MSQNESEQDAEYGTIISVFFWLKGKNKCPVHYTFSWSSMVSNVKVQNVK